MLPNTSEYSNQLQAKSQRLREQFADLHIPELELYASEPEHFRMRAEFRIWHQADELFYAYFPHADKSQPEFIQQFPIASRRINQLMPQLLDLIRPNPLLKNKLFQVDFLTGKSGEALISLLYHKKLGDDWQQAARELKQQLGVDLIGRSRGQKLCLDRDFITEVLEVEGQRLEYRQIENSFTQPNAGVAEQMLAWTRSIARELHGDLLELYCGNGNFSIALAPFFPRILATEIAKSSVEAAQHNLMVNRVDNVKIVRLASDEVSQALAGSRSFRRLQTINLADYQFNNLLLDPPRAGLDVATLNLARQFQHILYISCNPDTLVDNLKALGPGYRIRRFALFDQFPYTHHIETGVWLQRQDAPLAPT